MARVLSINVGLPRDIEWHGKTVHTAIWKEPVQGRRVVRRLNIDGICKVTEANTRRSSSTRSSRIAIGRISASLGIMGSVMRQATAAAVQLPIEGELLSLGALLGWHHR